MTEKRFTDRKMINNLGISFSVTKKDELHLTDPNGVDGWSVQHLLANKVSFYTLKYFNTFDLHNIYPQHSS